MIIYGLQGGSEMRSRLSSRRPCLSVHSRRRWTTFRGDDTSQHGRLRAAVKCPQISSENSATNAWDWNYNNQNWNNNNKSNNNSVVGVRDYE